jgi:hypothetical protein
VVQAALTMQVQVPGNYFWIFLREVSGTSTQQQ